MTAAEVLRRAAEAYRNGDIQWGRDDYIGADGCRCALGAIAFVVDPTDPDGDPRYAGPQAVMAACALSDLLVEEFGAARCVAEHDIDWIETVGGWNDDPSRTLDEVISALEAASERAA